MSHRRAVSYFVVDVCRALRRHLLHDVDRVSVISAHLLIVRAVSRVRRPQRDDDVAGLRAIVVGAGNAPASAPLGAGERRERQRWVVGVRVLGVPPPVADDADHGGHQEEEGGASCRAGDESNVRRLKGPVFTSVFSPITVGSSRVGGVARAT